MFEPLSDFIRLRRKQRNLTQEKLAELAKVSVRQLARLEDGHNVSVLLLKKVADALDLSDIPLGRLRPFTAPPEVARLLRAADAVHKLKQAVAGRTGSAATIDDYAGVLDGMIDTAIPGRLPEGSMELMEAAIDRFAKTPLEQLEAAGEELRRIARPHSFRRMPPKPIAADGESDDDPAS